MPTVNHTKSAIGVVSTSLHLIYLAEMAHKYRVGCLEIIVLLKRETDRPQIEKMLLEVPHIAAHWLVRTGSVENRFIALTELFSLNSLELSREAYDFGVFADYGRSLLANIQCEDYIWLGDGTKLLYETSSDVRYFNRYKRQKSAEPFVKLLLGKRLVLKKPPVIFTPFHLPSGVWESNTFEWLREKYDYAPQAADLDIVYFFGSYFSERSGKPLMTDEVYLSYLQVIGQYYAQKTLRVVYVPHRHESADKLNAIASLPGYEIQRFDYPAEMAFFKRGRFPAHIASFFSTCLLHFSVLGVCRSITSFRADFGKSNPAYGSIADSIYAALVRELGEDSVVDLQSMAENSR